MSAGPTAAVVLCNYNHGRFLPRSVEAILGQTRRPDQFFAIDDASTDDSPVILERYAARDPLLKIVRNERNRGVVDAMNRGLELAATDFVAMAASDDWLLPGMLETLLEAAALEPRAGAVCGMIRKVDIQGRDLGLFPSPIVAAKPAYLAPDTVRRRLAVYGDWFISNATLFRREAALSIGGFRPELRSYSDAFANRVLSRRFGCGYVPKAVACWRIMPAGFSASTQGNPAVGRSIAEAAEKVAQTDFQDVFPEAEYRKWRRWLRHDLAVAALRGGAGPAVTQTVAPLLAEFERKALERMIAAGGRRAAIAYLHLRLKADKIPPRLLQAVFRRVLRP